MLNLPFVFNSITTGGMCFGCLFVSFLVGCCIVFIKSARLVLTTVSRSNSSTKIHFAQNQSSSSSSLSSSSTTTTRTSRESHHNIKLTSKPCILMLLTILPVDLVKSYCFDTATGIQHDGPCNADDWPRMGQTRGGSKKSKKLSADTAAVSNDSLSKKSSKKSSATPRPVSAPTRSPVAAPTRPLNSSPPVKSSTRTSWRDEPVQPSTTLVTERQTFSPFNTKCRPKCLPKEVHCRFLQVVQTKRNQVGAVTELVGPAGTGKTQLALQLSAMMLKYNQRSLYIDTGN